MLIALAGQRESNWQEATSAAARAITNRIRLWDNILALLNNNDQLSQ
jgi:hypothetical protein